MEIKLADFFLRIINNAKNKTFDHGKYFYSYNDSDIIEEYQILLFDKHLILIDVRAKNETTSFGIAIDLRHNTVEGNICLGDSNDEYHYEIAISFNKEEEKLIYQAAQELISKYSEKG